MRAQRRNCQRQDDLPVNPQMGAAVNLRGFHQGIRDSVKELAQEENHHYIAGQLRQNQGPGGLKQIDPENPELTAEQHILGNHDRRERDHDGAQQEKEQSVPALIPDLGEGIGRGYGYQ